MFMVSIDYTVKETKQFDGGRDNSAVYTKIAQKIIKLITRPFTSENLYVYDTVHILRTGAVVIHCTHRLHQIRLHLTSFIAACSFTAEELGVSEQLQWWRDANLFVSTLQRWSPVFFSQNENQSISTRLLRFTVSRAAPICGGRASSGGQTGHYTVWVHLELVGCSWRFKLL